jgi:Fe(3+) dicitrate transport protein
MHTALRRSFVVAALLAAGTAPLHSQAQPAADDAAVDSLLADTVTSPVHRIPELTVVGDSRAALHRVPGSAAVLTRTDIRDMVRISGNEVLRTVPGVHVVEEEGAGMRANIGIRGLDPGRSRTVLILEDGVPVALAPYGEPEMYYTPPVDRMERIEVVKGSGSILFGPQTIGGVINYVTPAPPANPQASVELRAGNGGLGHLDARYGGRWGGVGAHVGVLHKRAADLRGLFYNITDVTGKTAFALSDRSDLTLKASAYDEDSNSTYVGLSEPMYRANPNHPSLAQEDRLDVRRYSVSAAHEHQFAPSLALQTTAYATNTVRNWNRQDFSVQDGEVVFRDTFGSRNRAFEFGGIEPRLRWDNALFGMDSELDAGVRIHWEQARDQRVNRATADAEGILRDDEVRTGVAVSGFVQNRLQIAPRVHLVPGLRVEHFSHDRNVLLRGHSEVDDYSSASIFEVIPGIGLAWQVGEDASIFAGAHRGFAPPRTKDAMVYAESGDLIALDLDAERSWNYELGVRSGVAPGVYLESTLFVLDFSNQIIPSAQWAGSVSDATIANQGQTRHAGIETAVSLDIGSWLGAPGRLRAGGNHTFVHARFTGDRHGETQQLVVNGNRLPYAPEHTLVGSLSAEPLRGWTTRVEAIYVADQFADNFETVEPSIDGRVGLIPSYDVWNVTTQWEMPRTGLTLFGSVKNLFDAEYIASRRPQGIKPGMPRQLIAGVRTTF